MFVPGSPCPYDCTLKNIYGYCQVTACTNYKYNGSGTWYAKTCQYCYKGWYDKDPNNNVCPHCGKESYRNAE